MPVDPNANPSYPVIRNTDPGVNDFGIVARIVPGVPINFNLEPATTAVVTSVAAAVISTTLLAANLGAIPRMASFFNNADRFCYLKLGPAASAIDFTVRLGPGGFYEMTEPGFDGIVTGVWDAGVAGAMLVTELT